MWDRWLVRRVLAAGQPAAGARAGPGEAPPSHTWRGLVLFLPGHGRKSTPELRRAPGGGHPPGMDTTATASIRQAEPGDWAVLRQVRLTALAEAPYAFWAKLDQEQPMTEEQWRARIQRTLHFLAWQDGVPVGLAAGFAEPPGTRQRRPGGGQTGPAAAGIWCRCGSARRRGAVALAEQLVQAVCGAARADGAAVSGSGSPTRTPGPRPSTSGWGSSGRAPARSSGPRNPTTGKRNGRWTSASRGPDQGQVVDTAHAAAQPGDVRAVHVQ